MIAVGQKRMNKLELAKQVSCTPLIAPGERCFTEMNWCLQPCGRIPVSKA
jgi:hypothetical protein